MIIERNKRSTVAITSIIMSTRSNKYNVMDARDFLSCLS